MPDTNEKTPTYGFWSLPGGMDGLHGSVDGVLDAIKAFTEIPEHSKTAIIEQIASHLEGTDHNYITIHAHAQGKHDGKTKHSMIGFEVASRRTL